MASRRGLYDSYCRIINWRLLTDHAASAFFAIGNQACRGGDRTPHVLQLLSLARGILNQRGDRPANSIGRVSVWSARATGSPPDRSRLVEEAVQCLLAFHCGEHYESRGSSALPVSTRRSITRDWISGVTIHSFAGDRRPNRSSGCVGEYTGRETRFVRHGEGRVHRDDLLSGAAQTALLKRRPNRTRPQKLLVS
jgi:hypothetical protein